MTHRSIMTIVCTQKEGELKRMASTISYKHNPSMIFFHNSIIVFILTKKKKIYYNASNHNTTIRVDPAESLKQWWTDPVE